MKHPFQFVAACALTAAMLVLLFQGVTGDIRAWDSPVEQPAPTRPKPPTCTPAAERPSGKSKSVKQEVLSFKPPAAVKEMEKDINWQALGFITQP